MKHDLALAETDDDGSERAYSNPEKEHRVASRRGVRTLPARAESDAEYYKIRFA